MIKFIPAFFIFSFILFASGLAQVQSPAQEGIPIQMQERERAPIRTEGPGQEQAQRQMQVQGQGQKEVVLLGTMHTVPESIAHAYKPLLKLALDYRPEAIYIERILPEDSVSREFVKNWSETFKSFYRLSDSLHSAGVSFEPEYVRSLLKKGPAKLAPREMEDALRYFAVEKDFANFDFYKYVQTYGPDGSAVPLRNENTDLSYPLALKMNIPLLKSMDSHQDEQAYHNACLDAAREGVKNGNYKIYRKLDRKDTRGDVIAGMTGRLGKHTNKRKALERRYLINSFRFAAVSTPAVQAAGYYWDLRNEKMAGNIARQVMAAPYTRNLVIVGAGHVLSLKKELEKNYPALRVRLILYPGD